MIQTLSQLIALVESDNNQYAIRFEPAHKVNPVFVSQFARALDFSQATGEVLLACSWGLYQIMGDELVALGMVLSPAQYCCSVAIQNNYLQKYLLQKGLGDMTLDDVVNDETKRLHFATIYNGPGNPQAYAARMMEIYARNQ